MNNYDNDRTADDYADYSASERYFKSRGEYDAVRAHDDKYILDRLNQREHDMAPF
jgi:hypothetical protein